jgi:hypothetical protein
MPARRKKPDWRALGVELVVVTLGVLLALAGQQAVQSLNWRADLKDTRASVHEQLSYGAHSAYERMAIGVCERDRLDLLRDRLLASGPAWPGAPLATDNWLQRGAEVAYRTPVRRWSTSAWEAAVASSAASHMKPAEMTRHAAAHEYLQSARRFNDAEALYVADLSVLARPGPMSEDLRGRMLATLARARMANAQIVGLSEIILHHFATLGIRLSPADQAQVLAEMRATYGACVVVPPPPTHRRSTSAPLV